MNKIEELSNKIIKDPFRLVLKIFILLWVFLILHVLLKLTFNYWQPYVIPTHQLEQLGNFIDTHKLLKAFLDSIFYLTNAFFMIMIGLQQWRFTNNKQRLIFYIGCTISFILNYLELDTISTILILVTPIIINYKKVHYIIMSFILSFIFLAGSLYIEGFTTANNMNYVIATFLQGDYYIMLAVTYVLSNILRIRKGMK